MKTLVVFDVDDTIFHIDVPLKVLDDDGNVIQTMRGQEVYALSNEQIESMKFCMLDYACSETFYNTSKPIPGMVELVQKSLQGDDDVLFITARHGIDNRSRYIEKFHDHDMLIHDHQIHFVGRWRPDRRTKTSASDDKRVKFEEIMQSQLYDHITIYDDSTKNLDALWEISLDYPVSISLFHVSKEGMPNLYFL